MLRPHRLGFLAYISFFVACETLEIADKDNVYYKWDGREVICGVSLDDRGSNSVDSIEGGMVRALATDSVLILYGHKPGRDFSLAKMESIIAAASSVGVPFLTTDDLLDGPQRAGVSLTFDDAHIDDWYSMTRNWPGQNVRATFFVTRPGKLTPEQIVMLHEMQDEGNAIEYHGMNHLNAPDYVEEFGLHAYMQNEFLNGLQIMNELGFSPRAFAYPFGHRTSEIDDAVLAHIELARSLSFTLNVASNPCPF